MLHSTVQKKLKVTLECITVNQEPHGRLGEVILESIHFPCFSYRRDFLPNPLLAQDFQKTYVLLGTVSYHSNFCAIFEANII